MTQDAQRTVSRTDVCIVGGGPAGLLAGLLLARRGARVTVLEAHETFDREFRGEVLQPSTARLLDQVGLLQYILAEPHLILDSGKLVIHGKVAGEFRFQQISPEYPYAIWMPQPVFLNALARKGRELPGFTCRMGAKVTGLVEENGAVAGVRGTEHGKQPFEVRADVVLGADGRHSTLRRAGGFEIEYEHHDFDIVWFVVDPPPDWPRTIYFSVGKLPHLMLPKYPEQIQVGLVLHRDEWRQWMAGGHAALAARLRDLNPLFRSFADSMHDFTPFFPLAAVISLLKKWSRDGLLMIGDSAHTMSPAGAIGVNVALATAAIAAQVVFPELGQGPIPATALQKVQELREPDVRTLHRLQRGAGRALLGSGSRNSLVRTLMPIVLPLALKSGLMPRVQRRLFFGAPLPPFDREFAFTPGP